VLKMALHPKSGFMPFPQLHPPDVKGLN